MGDTFPCSWCGNPIAYGEAHECPPGTTFHVTSRGETETAGLLSQVELVPEPPQVSVTIDVAAVLNLCRSRADALEFLRGVADIFMPIPQEATDAS